MMHISRLWREARARQGAGETWLLPFLGLMLLIFLGDLASGPGRTLLPVYGEAVLKRPPYFTSTLISLQVLFGAVSAVAGGALSDSLGQKRVLLLGLSGVPLIGLGFIVRSPWALALFWVYIGFAFGAYTIGRQAYMMAAVPSSRLGMATAVMYLGLTLGSALGNSLAGPVLDRYDFGTLGAGMAALGLLVLLQSFAGYAAMLRRPPVLLMGALRFIPTSYWGTASLLMPLLIYRAAGAPSAAAYYGTANLLFASACQLLTGRLIDRYGVRRLVIVLPALIVLWSLAISFVTGSVVGLFAVGILAAGTAWSLSVTIPGVVNGIVPREEHGRALGFSHLAWSAGMLLGTQLGGWLVEVDVSLPFLAMGAFNVLTVVCAVVLGRYLGRQEAGAERGLETRG